MVIKALVTWYQQAPVDQLYEAADKNTEYVLQWYW